MRQVLVIDDDEEVRDVLQEILASDGLDVVTAADGPAGLAILARELPAVVTLDVGMPAMSGVDVLRQVKADHPRLPVIMLTSSLDVRTAVDAMKLGAFDYMTKPFDAEEVILHVRRAVEWHAMNAEVTALRRQLESTGVARDLTGSSPQIRGVLRQIERVARFPITVLIQGESGTGKELAARTIHEWSDRADKAFIAVDCGALPETLIESELFGHEKGAFTGADRRKEGQFQLADGGTLFLDEVANLPVGMQGKLLRVLQQREVRPLGGTPRHVDVRVIAACNVALDAEVQAKRFREDLYYRLAEFVLTMPSLRSRREDVPALTRRFLTEANLEFKHSVRGVSDEATALLAQHDWPGNVRELRNVIRRAVLLATDLVEARHLDHSSRTLQSRMAGETPCGAEMDLVTGVTLKQAHDRGAADAERHVIRWALSTTDGNKSKAAKLLQTDYKTLHTKVKQYGITAEF